MTDESMNRPRRLNRPYWLEDDDERPPVRRGEEEEGEASYCAEGRADGRAGGRADGCEEGRADGCEDERADERAAALAALAAMDRRPSRRTRRWHTEPAGKGALLSSGQLDQLQAVAQTYTPDLHDAAAAEVLLVLLEIGNILGLSEAQLNRIFGPRCRRVLSDWGDVVPPRGRPAEVQRAWVWLSNRRSPALYPIGEDGAIRVYE